MQLHWEKRCNMFVIISTSFGRHVWSLISSTSLTKAIKNYAKQTAPALWYCTLQIELVKDLLTMEW